MPLSNTDRRFGSLAKAFHWASAALILVLFPLGFLAHDAAERIAAGAAADPAAVARAAALFSAHKTTGVALFLLALARVGWTLTQPRPGLLNADNRAEALAAETVHWLLYALLLLVPATGWLHHAATEGFAPILWPLGQGLPFVPRDAGLAEFFAALHGALQWLLLAALGLHVAGALKHHLIDGDATLRRMLPGQTAPLPEPAAPAARHALVPPLLAALLLAVAAGLSGAPWPRDAAPAAPRAEAPAPAPAAGRAGAAAWQVTEGRLGLVITQMGNRVAGQFDDWQAEIDFTPRRDPGRAGSVAVVVDIGTLRLGSVSEQAMGPDYFDVARHATARFDAEILRTAQGYEARGDLTIRGRTLPAVLPFTLALEGDTARAEGRLVVNRLDFGIGGSVTDPATLAPEVTVEVALTARRAGMGS